MELRFFKKEYLPAIYYWYECDEDSLKEVIIRTWESLTDDEFPNELLLIKVTEEELNDYEELLNRA